MVFWLHYPGTIKPWIKGDFRITLFEKNRLSSPTGISAIILSYDISTSLRTEICEYLSMYFGNPPYTPLFLIMNQLKNLMIIVIMELLTHIIICGNIY